MTTPAQLIQTIHDKLDAGLLPTEVTGSLFAGYGTSLPCDGCDTLIVRAQVEWEYATAEGRIVRFHIGCAAIWDVERRGPPSGLN